MATSPYVGLPDHRFWRKAVVEMQPAAVDPIIDLPFQIHPADKVATGGSCFAQHIANRLQGSGLQYYQVEQPPAGMGAAEAVERGYGVYSCRYGNIYTTRQLLQLFDRAFGLLSPTLDWWRRPDGRYVDPFRPRIEPEGFATVEDMQKDRDRHLAAVRQMLETMDVFVFTFGLTESWVHKEDGVVLPLAPGVAGGAWDETRYAFWNARASEVAADYLAFVDKLKAVNPKVRLVVTVSPVPLIATYTPQHVLVANQASKAKLRAACDEVIAARPEIAYFPSYDLVSFGPNAGCYYNSDLRELNPVGLDAVMRTFFAHFAPESGAAGKRPDDEVAADPSITGTIADHDHAFPARLWSIHTPRQLLQLFDRAYGLFWPQDEAWADEDGSYIDPFRPRANEGGFSSPADLETDRDAQLAAVRSLFETGDDLIATFEPAAAWEASSDGAIFSMPPPVAQAREAGAYRLRAFEAAEMEADLRCVMEKLHHVNPRLRLMLAVAPPTLACENGHVSRSVALGTAALKAAVDRIVQDAPLAATPEGEQAPAPVGFDADISISHLRTVICDEAAIEQSLQEVG